MRIAALKALRDQAGLAELPALLNILVKARSAAESQAAESALGALCARQSGPASGNVVIVKAEYGDLPDGPSADVTKKVAALVKAGALAVDASNGNFGDPANGRVKKLRVEYTVNGVPASKTVARAGDAHVHRDLDAPGDRRCDLRGDGRRPGRGEARAAASAAIGRRAQGPRRPSRPPRPTTTPRSRTPRSARCATGPRPTPCPLVADLVKTPPSKTIKVLALRGFVRLVPQQDAPDAKKLESLKDAMALADRNEEKRLVLSALGNVPTVEALALVASHLDNAALKEEACLAAVAIAEKIGAGHAAEVAAAMKQVAKLTANKKLAARADAIARKAKN